MTRKIGCLALLGAWACAADPPEPLASDTYAVPPEPGGGGAGGAAIGGGAAGGAAIAGEAAEYFAANVHPALIPTCGKCHVGGAFDAPLWLAADAAPAYERIHSYGGGALAAPAASNLLLYKGAHQGPELTAIQAGIVEKWLGLEHPGEGGAPSSDTLASALERFGACMDLGEWQLRDLDQLAGVTVNGGCSCATCHSDGAQAGGFELSEDAGSTFEAARTFPGIMKLVTGSVTAGGAFAGLVPAGRIADKGFESVDCACGGVVGLSPEDEGYCHPNYDLPLSLEENVEKFVALTILLSDGQDCGIR